MAEWPPLLPFFSALNSLSRTGPQGALIRTSMDAGPDKVRRRTTAAPLRFTGRTPFLSRAEVAVFEEWFVDLVASGALPFVAVDPMDCQPKTFRFLDSYTVTRIGNKFQVSADLEILP